YKAIVTKYKTMAHYFLFKDKCNENARKNTQSYFSKRISVKYGNCKINIDGNNDQLLQNAIDGSVIKKLLASDPLSQSSDTDDADDKAEKGIQKIFVAFPDMTGNDVWYQLNGPVDKAKDLVSKVYPKIREIGHKIKV